ncbi:MAG: xylulose kinase [Actinobacteria bacterium]|nr:xylulose kinase [Actinomycetota bacterium]
MPVVIGVDSSTQSTKVELRDLDSGELVASGRATHPDTGAAPLSETDPKEWLKAFNAALEIATASKAQTKFAAISVAGQQHGLVTGTGYWSAKTNQYDDEVLKIIDSKRDWSNALPRVASPLEQTGLWRDAVIGCGTGDNMAGALGIGLQPSDVAISLGTSGTVYAVSATPTNDPSGAVAGFADATGAYLPLVCTMNATKVFDKFANVLNCDLQQFGELALGSECGAHDLVLLPYLDGERTPNLPDARATLVGLNSNHTRNDVARAAIEGVVCGLLDGLTAINNCGVDTSGRIFILGGGAQSRAVCQIVADLTGKQVLVLNEPEIVALGAARQAAATLTGKWPTWQASSKIAAQPTASSTQSNATRQRFAEARFKNFGV